MPPTGCPYVGLSYFDEKNQPYFFGRDSKFRRLARRILTSGLVVLHGASGVGKTSVLLAGAVPELKKLSRAIVVPYRAWQTRGLVAHLLRELEPHAKSPLEGLPLFEATARVVTDSRLPVILVLDQFEEYFQYREGVHGPDVFISSPPWRWPPTCG